MGLESFFHYVSLTAQVFLLDLLLSVDNALVIALACRSLPPAHKRPGMLIGTGAAIVLRSLLTIFASFLLTVPLLKLVGGFALVIIAIKLILAEEEQVNAMEGVSSAPSSFWPIVGAMIVADLVMSVDHVVGLAAISQGSVVALVLGLLMSVPLLVFGSQFVAALLRRYPLLIRGGGAALAWLAGDIAITDQAIAGWVNQQAPALNTVVPILVAVFVLLQARLMAQMQSTAKALRPKARRRAVTPHAVLAEPEKNRGANTTPDGALVVDNSRVPWIRSLRRVLFTRAALRVLVDWWLSSFMVAVAFMYFLKPTGTLAIAVRVVGILAITAGPLAHIVLARRRLIRAPCKSAQP